MYLSVIIPVYNTEKELVERCVKSVLNQDFSDFEIIIADDGSDAAHKAVLDNLASMDSRIRLLHQENRRVSVARNRGVNKASGEYIVFVDADDVLVSYFFKEAIQIKQEHDVDLLVGVNTHLHNDSLAVKYA